MTERNYAGRFTSGANPLADRGDLVRIHSPGAAWTGAVTSAAWQTYVICTAYWGMGHGRACEAARAAVYLHADFKPGTYPNDNIAGPWDVTINVRNDMHEALNKLAADVQARGWAITGWPIPRYGHTFK